MKYLKTYEINSKFKIGDYVQHMEDLVKGINKFYIITNINFDNKPTPYRCENVMDDDNWFWEGSFALYKASETKEEIEGIISANKYNL